MRMAPAPGRRTLVAAAALAAAAIAVPLGFGSSHREAPNIMLDPSADNTDVYAYTAADATDALTIVSNWIPGQVPANGPNFFRFDDRARYYINVDSNGNGLPDVDYQFRFNTEVANPNSFLNAGPGAQDYGDLNLSQTYDVVRREYNGAGTRVTGSEKVGDDLNVAPSNIGPKTYPNYDNFVNGAKQTLADGTKLFVGQREDPFYVDLGAAFDAINIRYDGTTGNQGGGKDDFSGYNTSSIVMQLPEELVTRDGQSVANADAKNAVVGVWSTTERRALEVTGADYDERGGSGGWVQVSRLGNPLINEVIIPLGEKDRFNRTEPADDAANYGEYVLKPELAAVMNALFNIGAPEENRTDLLPLLTGIQGLNQHKGRFAGTPVDTLKVNLGTPPAATEDRFGVIGGDVAGFPNGRRPGDDVVDISLQVVAGFLASPQNAVPVGDGVDGNDVPFDNTFPYIGDPFSGFDSEPSTRIEPTHPPVPAGG